MHVLDFDEELHEKSLIEYEIEYGIEQGIKLGISELVTGMLKAGKTPEEISEFCRIPLDRISRIAESQTRRKV